MKGPWFLLAGVFGLAMVAFGSLASAPWGNVLTYGCMILLSIGVILTFVELRTAWRERRGR